AAAGGDGRLAGGQHLGVTALDRLARLAELAADVNAAVRREVALADAHCQELRRAVGFVQGELAPEDGTARTEEDAREEGVASPEIPHLVPQVLHLLFNGGAAVLGERAQAGLCPAVFRESYKRAGVIAQKDADRAVAGLGAAENAREGVVV